MTNPDKARPRSRLIVGFAVSALIVGGALGLRVGYAQVPNPPKASGWLKKLAPEQQTEAIDRQFRGFDMAMVEVGYRYTEMYFASIEGNWDYALYTGEKMAWAIQNGYERRPARRANAEQMFFKEAYPQVLDAIRKKDAALFKQRVDALRHACNACHGAERVPFIKVGLPTAKQMPLVND
jgi:hypothetical protein